MDDRRTTSRRIACIPAYLDTVKDEHDLALIRDVSATGARLFTRTALPVGLEVRLELYIRGDAGPPTVATGRVVRSDRRDPALSDVWPWEVGVELETPLEDHDHEIEALSERQLAMGIIKP
ncbi:MAG TPA: PilZ domain-containing protein [Polyangiaceae bacterium]|nr:PilZ domain-containing protein [Polyangiaceae bacterium]